jgi:tetratricopeptide (TPR) repeat protein
VAAALTQAIGLNPDLAQAHARLGDLYAEMGCMDLALKHQRAYLAAVRKAGPPGGTEPAGFHQQTAALEGQLGQLADAIAERERVFLRDAAGVRVLDRAVLARDQGLVGRALDVLLQSDISAFGASGMALELELLLRTGRVKDVRDWTDPDHQSALGPRYHWLRAQALAASGEYAAAQDECRLLGAGDLTAPGGPRAVLAVVVGQAALDEQPGAGGLGWLIGRALPRADYDRRVTGLTREIQRAADASVLRGLIALEAGDVGEAEVAFRLALDTWTDEAAARSGRGLDFTGRPVAQGCLKWIDAGGRGK